MYAYVTIIDMITINCSQFTDFFLEKVINLAYGHLSSRKRLSQNLPSRNGNLEFNLEKTLGPPPGVWCVGCVWWGTC